MSLPYTYVGGTDITSLPARPKAELMVRPEPKPKVKLTHAPSLTPIGETRTGWATYYCCTRGYQGQAVVALKGWHYVPRGRTIKRWAKVCVIDRNPFKAGNQGPKACRTFPAVDYCACGPRHGRPTLVDLSYTARNQLGLDPGMGYYLVTVTPQR